MTDPRSGGTPAAASSDPAARLAEIQRLLDGELDERHPWPGAELGDAVRFLLAEVARLTAENKAHAEWARDYGKTPDGEAWQAAIRERNGLRAEVASLREALTEAKWLIEHHASDMSTVEEWDEFLPRRKAWLGALAPASREPQ